jgi:hypothetical protein
MPQKVYRSVMVFTLLALLLDASGAFAVSHNKKTKRKFRHRIVWNPLVKGSHDSMLRQNAEIDRLQLPRIQDDDELLDLEARNELVEIPDGTGFKVASNIQPIHRFCKPWTLQFLQDLGEAYFAEFNSSLQVTSAVRTMQQQKKLRRHNRNAAPIDGDTASSHLAGTSIDLAKHGLSKKQKTWLSLYLKDLYDQGLIEAAEERRQACFHIMVVERYAERHNPQPAESVPSIAGADDFGGPE